jgi:hypothetical protein
VAIVVEEHVLLPTALAGEDADRSQHAQTRP